jgi:drug/metabolite transporter (DMT)-like permease
MQSHSVKDWALLMALVFMWGSSFMFNKLVIATVPPATLVAGRLVVSAAILLVVVYARGSRLPPLGKAWWSFLALAIIGNALPFYLIGWGQKVVDSALAGILMAGMPLATLVLAHFLIATEPMTRNRVVGFAVGFAGIVLLMGPAALRGIGGSLLQVVSELAILGAALCYALNSVLARLLVKGNFVVSSAAVLLAASVVAVPFALVLDRPWTLAPSFSSIASLVWLGIGPTAIATICYFRLISSAGATFMSLVNYLAPCVALFAGVALLGEAPGPTAYAGLVLILIGIALSQFRRS